jgi:PKD repeat protein
LDWEYLLPLSSQAITHLGVGDVDDDGKTEIIAVEGHTGMSWNENFVFRSASSDAIVYIIGYSGGAYSVEKQVQVDVGGAFCAEVGDVDNDGVPEILLGGTGYDEVNDDPFVGQIEVIDYDGSNYNVVWESGYLYNWVMGVAIGDLNGDFINDIVTEDYDDNLGSNVIRIYQWTGSTYNEVYTIPIDSESMALEIGDSDSDTTLEVATKGIFSGLFEVFGKSGSTFTQEWSSGAFTTFIDECIEITNINPGEKEYLIFGELGVFIFENIGGTYQQIWHSPEIPASVKNVHVNDIDAYPGKDIIGSSGGYNFIYGEGGFPVADLLASKTSVEVGEVIIFDGSSSFGSGQLEYDFDFGDGMTTGWITSPLKTHSYSSQGTYIVSLRVRDESGTESPQPAQVTIFVSQQAGKPIAVIDSISPNPAKPQEIVSFSGHGTDNGQIVEYRWESSLNGFLDNRESFTYSGLLVGNHEISFTVKNDNGIWSDPATTQLRINEIPTANIDSITPSSPNEGDNIRFEGSGVDDDTIVGYNWRSSITGFLSNSNTFSTQTLSAGTHMIYFKVLDSDGEWSKEVSKSLKINQYPIANIESVSPNETLVGELIFFVGTGEDDGSISSYSWESSIDGVLSSKAQFSTASLTPGVHIISFTVEDNKGVASEPDEVVIIIKEKPENIPPIAVIDSVNPTRITEGEEVTFVGHGDDPDNKIKEYFWESDFDGLLSDERSFTTSTLTVGTHVISFRVRDEAGDWSESEEVIVQVIEKEEDDFFAFLNFDMESFEEEPEICLLYLFVVGIIIFVIIVAVVQARKRRRGPPQNQY